MCYGGKTMKNNVLFINRNQMEIQEFLNAMQDYDFEIDTADSGLEAAILLRKKNYKVVITGMNLSTYDGMKLLAYLNGYSPYTACIVYTTTINLAQLRVLVNERDIFRIFLKPVNYRGDFYHAIQDGFAYYDMRQAEQEEQKVLELKQKSIENIAKQESTATGEWEWKQMGQFMSRILPWSVKNFQIPLNEEEQKVFHTFEQKILDYYLGGDYAVCDNIETVCRRIQEEFETDGIMQQIIIDINQRPVNPKTGFYEQLHFILWLLLTQVAIISPDYVITITMNFELPFRPIVVIKAKVPEEKIKEYQENSVIRNEVKVVSCIVETFTEQCNVEVSIDGVLCQLQLRTEERKKAK